MRPLYALLAVAGAGVAAAVYLKTKKPTTTKTAKGPEPKKMKAEPVEVNQSKAVLATVDEGTTARSSTINSLGKRGGMTGRTAPAGASSTLGSVISTMMSNEGPEAFDRKRKATGPFGSIVTEPRTTPRGMPLSTMANAYSRASNQITPMPGVGQMINKSDANMVLSPKAAPQLARGTGFTLK